MVTNVTTLLKDWGRGDQEALNQLMPLVYDQLRYLAINRLKQERSDHTLQPTALVNEVYLRLVDWQDVDWKNRAQFFAVAAQLMRNILVDYVRNQLAAKRGGERTKLYISDLPEIVAEQPIDLLALNEALIALSVIDPQQHQIVELRYFAGLTIEETSLVLELSATTVKREWNIARAWLLRELTNQNK
ncbi:MAG: sigma-70 family RNA polymerase sigma factor [Acidobacteria bacterium]|nr:sigma-70 family RNA polymerase sigma factor [Acidobacteriota bacterium]